MNKKNISKKTEQLRVGLRNQKKNNKLYQV